MHRLNTHITIAIAVQMHISLIIWPKLFVDKHRIFKYAICHGIMWDTIHI